MGFPPSTSTTPPPQRCPTSLRWHFGHLHHRSIWNSPGETSVAVEVRMTAVMANKNGRRGKTWLIYKKYGGGHVLMVSTMATLIFRGKEKNPSIFKLQICLSCFSKDYLRFSNKKFLDFKFRVVWTTVMIWGHKLNIGWFGIRSANQGWFAGYVNSKPASKTKMMALFPAGGHWGWAPSNSHGYDSYDIPLDLDESFFSFNFCRAKCTKSMSISDGFRFARDI